MKLLFLRLVLATQGLGLMVPNIEDLLPDVDSTILSGVLEIIVEVSIQSFEAYMSSFHAFERGLILVCSVSRMWVTSLVTVCVLARLSCRHQILWIKYTGASWKVI
jgi:hypothetical protein